MKGTPLPAPPPLRAVARALTWEYLRRAGSSALSVTAAVCALAGLYRSALEPFGERRDVLVFTAVFATLLVVFVMTLLTATGSGAGFDRRLYRMPASTTTLVLGRLLPAVGTGALMYLATASFASLVLGTRWPLLGPVLVLTAALVWGSALSWTLGPRPELLLPAGAGPALALFLLVRPMLRPVGESPLTSWTPLLGPRGAGLAGLIVAGVLLAIAGVRLDRTERGPARTHPDGAARLRGRRRDEDLPPFTDARRALLWREWREKGRWLPLYTAFALATLIATDSFPDFETGPILRSALVCLVAVFVLAPPTSGLLHGRFGMAGEAELDRVRATAPTSDRRLAWMLLEASTRAALASLAVAVIGAAAVFVVLFAFGDGSHVARVVEGLVEALRRPAPIDVVLALGLAIGFTTALGGVVLSLAVSGRDALLHVFVAVPVGLLVVGFVAERITGSAAWRDALPGLASAAALAGPFVVAGAGVGAERIGGVSRTVVATVLGADLATTILVASRTDALSAGTVTGWLLPTAVSWIFVPPLLAPAMLAWNRHR